MFDSHATATLIIIQPRRILTVGQQVLCFHFNSSIYIYVYICFFSCKFSSLNGDVCLKHMFGEDRPGKTTLQWADNKQRAKVGGPKHNGVCCFTQKAASNECRTGNLAPLLIFQRPPPAIPAHGRVCATEIFCWQRGLFKMSGRRWAVGGGCFVPLLPHRFVLFFSAFIEIIILIIGNKQRDPDGPRKCYGIYMTIYVVHIQYIWCEQWKQWVGWASGWPAGCEWATYGARWL